ncbi:MAG: hypothetical protein WC807_07205 [Hyphomicrobium sp.]|jgi:hypothetical protein
MKQSASALVVAAGLLIVNVSGASAADKTCLPIGGEALGQFYNEGKDVVGAMMGTWSSTRGTVKSEKKTATGLSFDMEHVFSTNAGGVVRTKDVAELTPVPGKQDSYMLEVTYTVVESLGNLKGYAGTFNSFGLLKTNTGEGLVRYMGEICK